MKDYRKQIESIPSGRKREVVELRREVMVSMYKDGYNLSQIARAFGYNHTTVWHHLQTVGIRTSKNYCSRLKRKKGGARDYLAKVRRHIQTIRERMAKRSEAERVARERQALKEIERKELEDLRERAFGLYKDGFSYSSIATILGVFPTRVQALLSHHPEFRTNMRQQRNLRRGVNQFTKDHVLVKYWPSISMAARDVGCNRATIVMAAKGRIRSAAGFLWEYED